MFENNIHRSVALTGSPRMIPCHQSCVRAELPAPHLHHLAILFAATLVMYGACLP